MTLWDQRRNEDILAETEELPVEDQLKLKRPATGSSDKYSNAALRAKGGSLEESLSTG